MDIVVCGGGVSGTMAAIAAARTGAKTLLVERGGCLGGMWTAGLLGYSLDTWNKGGLLKEFLDDLRQETESSGAAIYEAQKYLLEKKCAESGVRVLLHTQVCDVTVQDGRIISLEIITKSGKQRISPSVVIDATGDGDVAYMAGCAYSYGNDEGKAQPMSMIAVLSGICEEQAREYISYPDTPFWEARGKLLKLLQSIGVDPSMSCPSIMKINDSLFYFSINHEYDKRSDSAEDITDATFSARREIYEAVRALRQKGGPAFKNVTLVATPEMIGVREGRRIHGVYTVTVDDMIQGKTHDDAVCRVNYWVDIHALSPASNRSFSDGNIKAKPYDIPFRAMLPQKIKNLILSGRCISGDFYAHASYRVTGNMAAVGEAAGVMAAASVLKNTDLTYLNFSECMKEYRNA